MKLEILAGLLEKPATELATTLNVAEASDVADSVSSKALKEHILEAVETAKLKAKSEAEGKQTRLTKLALEKTVKEKFAFIKATSIDEMLVELETEFAKRAPENSEAQKLEIEALKLKAKTAEDKLTLKEQEIAEAAQVGAISKKLEKHLAKYEFASDEVKQIAVTNYIKANKFIVSGDDLFLEKEGKPVVNFDKDIEAHLVKFGKIVTPGKTTSVPGETPKNDLPDTTRKGLFTALRSATDPAERARIQEQINSLAEE